MANLSIRIEDSLKHDAETVLDDIGISLSAAITITLKQIVRYKGIPFELRAGSPLCAPVVRTDKAHKQEALARLVGLTAENPVSLEEAKAERLSRQ